MRRVTVSLDDEAVSKLEELAKRENRSLSEIVRSAISSYYDLSLSDAPKPEFLDELLDLLASREHVIVDAGLWSEILEEINKNAEEEFWKTVEKVGEEYGIQLREKGLKSARDVLKYLEMENWFRMKAVSDRTFNLVLTVSSELKILKKLLETIFKTMGFDVEIIEGLRKIIVKEGNSNETA